MNRFLVAAEKGDADAQFNLGVMYDNGLDDNNRPNGGNRAEAVKWLSRAAEQGLARAQMKLAELYADRWTSQQDYVKACFWFLLATMSLTGIYRQRAESGYQRASAQLTPTQVAETRHLAEIWSPVRQTGAVAAGSPWNPLLKRIVGLPHGI